LSSILKALQKLESESAKVDRDKSWLKRGASGRTYAEGSQKKWTSGWSLLLLGTLIILAGGAGVIFSSKLFRQGRSGATRAPQKVGPMTTAKDFATPELVFDLEGTNIKVRGSSGGKLKEDASSGRNNLQGVGKTKKNIHPIISTPEAGAGKPEIVGTQNTSAPPNGKATIGSIGSVKVKEPPLPAESREIASIKVLEGTEMKLQAISWSPGVERRIAVINNRIVKEGDRVNGFLVHRINRDDVILNKDEELWKLSFSP
jgi:hypothetical protein